MSLDDVSQYMILKKKNLNNILINMTKTLSTWKLNNKTEHLVTKIIKQACEREKERKGEREMYKDYLMTDKSPSLSGLRCF